MHMSTAPTKRKLWTLAELHRLPDDGNKYELIRGELFVTPPPTEPHETIAARLTRLLDPFVAQHGLGFVYHPKAVFRTGKGSEVEPDLMVRLPHPAPTGRDGDWRTAPKPILIVEIASPSTRRRDRQQKREFYLESRIPEYWMVDAETRVITVVRPGEPDREESERVIWRPAGVSDALELDVAAVFAD